MVKGVVQSLSCVQLLATPRTVTHQAPLSVDFPGRNTGVGCHFLLQRIFQTQRSNPHLLLGRWVLYHWADINDIKLFFLPPPPPLPDKVFSALALWTFGAGRYFDLGAIRGTALCVVGCSTVYLISTY